MPTVKPAKGASKREHTPSVQADTGTLIRTRRESLAREANELFEAWQCIGDDRYLKAAQLLEALGKVLGATEYFRAGEKPKTGADAINEATARLRCFTHDETTHYPDAGHRKPLAEQLHEKLVSVLQHPEELGTGDVAAFLDVVTRFPNYDRIFGRPGPQEDRATRWRPIIEQVRDTTETDKHGKLATEILKAVARAEGYEARTGARLSNLFKDR